MSAEPDRLVITLHTKIPAAEAVRRALFAHLEDMATTLADSGWHAEVNLIMTKDKTDD